MYSYMILQDQARARALKKKSQSLEPQSSKPKKTEKKKQESTSSDSSSSIMTPPSTPTLHDVFQPQPQHLYPIEQPQFNDQYQKAAGALSPRTLQLPLIFRDTQPSEKSELNKSNIALLKESWYGSLSPSDPFDIVGEQYTNISEACASTDFWRRCLEELQMANAAQLRNSNKGVFVHSFSTHFYESLKLIFKYIDKNQNIQVLAYLKDELSTNARRLDRLFGLSSSFSELLRIGFISTLLDSFADAFTEDLQLAWKILFKLVIQLMASSLTDPHAIIEEAEPLSPVTTITNSVFSTRQDSRLSKTSVLTSNSSTINSPSTTTLDPKMQSPTPSNHENFVSSFYAKPPSLPRRSSFGSVKSTAPSGKSGSALSKTDSNVSSNSGASSINTSVTTKKFYNGKPIPLFILQDLERKATVSTAATSSSSGSSQSDKSNETYALKTTRKKKTTKLLGNILFPTGSMGPLMP